MSPLLPFSQTLSDFENQSNQFSTYEPQGSSLGSLIAPVSAQQTPVQNTSLAGSIAGKAADAVLGGTVSTLFSSRFIAFGLGFLLVGGALLIFAFQSAEKGVNVILGGKNRVKGLADSVAALSA